MDCNDILWEVICRDILHSLCWYCTNGFTSATRSLLYYNASVHMDCFLFWYMSIIKGIICGTMHLMQRVTGAEPWTWPLTLTHSGNWVYIVIYRTAVRAIWLIGVTSAEHWAWSLFVHVNLDSHQTECIKSLFFCLTLM